MRCTKEGLEVNLYATDDCSGDPVDAVSTVVKWGACHKANSDVGVVSYLKMGPDPKDGASGASGLKAAAAAVLAIAASQF